VDARLTGKALLRHTAAGRLLVRQGVDALLPSQLLATQEKPGAEGTGVEIWVRGFHFAGQRRICCPYGMIGMGAAAIEARYMASDLTDWHQALARVSAAEEEARTLEAQNNTLCGQHD